MTSDPSISTLEPASLLSTEAPGCGQAPTPLRYKYRVRFTKAGNLRLVSHHDLMHVCERMFRRADLPVPSTQGFNPRPRMWFAVPLALGVAGLREILEFELSQPLPAEEVERRLSNQAPPGLGILGTTPIDFRAAARVRRMIYRLPLAAPVADLGQRCEAFLARTEYHVERMRPRPRRINIRPFVDELRVVPLAPSPEGRGENCLEMALWNTSNGAARPDEVAIALGLGDLLGDGAVIARTDLEVFDELPEGISGPPLIESAIEEITANDEDLPAARPHAIVDSPMSFET